MQTKNRFSKIITTLVALGLLLQPFAPLVALSTTAGVMNVRQAAAETAVSAPAALSTQGQPVSISRWQSGYAGGNAIDVVYTVTNNQMPTLLPDIPESATITDTIDLLAAVDVAADANTLRDVTVQTTLTNGTLINGHGAIVSGNQLTWNLADIPPMGSTTISMTVQAPIAGAAFIELDSGADLSAVLWQMPVATNARPAAIVPAGIDPAYLANTPDASTSDAVMLGVSAESTQSPAAAFALVQSFAFDPYVGSLRGTRGTILGEAGNALDQASALIAMLRAAGVPARYRHGTLSQADAQTIIAAMFPPDSGVAGNLPVGPVVSDPLNDPALLDLVQDHWWVEAYLPETGAWTDLDPTFPGAEMGDSFATPGLHDGVAEIPDTLRHKTAVQVRREYYSSFPIGGVFLVEEPLMEVEYATAELAGHALTFAHMVNTDSQGGLVSSTTIHTYTPYFMVDDDTENAILGSTFQDLLTTFPLATSFTTAEWLTFTLTDANGNVETFERVVKDDLGQDVRLNGGSPNLARGDDSPPFFGASDLMTTLFLPNAINALTLDQVRGTMLARLVDVAGVVSLVNQITDDGSPNPEADALAAEATLALQVLIAQTHALTAYDFAITGDQLLQQLSHGLQVKMFYALPRVVMLTTTADEEAGTTSETMDLRNTTAVTIAAPGQAKAAALTANWLKGVTESRLEGAALDAFYDDQTAVTTALIFDEMVAQGIEPVLITPEEMGLLDIYPFPAETRARLTTALVAGKTVLVPAAPVLVDGVATSGWWEIDPETGDTIGVLENGTHGALLEYLNWLGYKRYKAINRLFGKPVELLYDYLVANLVPALGGTPPAAAGFTANAPENEVLWRNLPGHLCPIENCGIEQFFLNDVAASPIPLPDMTFAYAQPAPVMDESVATIVSVSDDGSGGADSASLSPSPAAANITPFASATFDAGLTANFADDFVLQLHAPAGWQASLDGSSATVTPPTDAAAGVYDVVLVAQSKSQPDVVTTAVFPVTITAVDLLGFDVMVEPNITIPQNDALETAVSNETNDGEAEIPAGAYHIDIANQASQEKSFSVNVTGAPAGWVILDGTQQTATAVTLAAGEQTSLGLYLVPDTLPAPGTSHTINVAVSDGGSLSAAEDIVWTMPGQAHNYLTLAPDTLFVQANSSVDFELTMRNVGNAAGSFPITAATPLTSATISNLQSPVFLNPSGSDTQNLTLTVGEAVLGSRYPLQFASMAPNSYTQFAFADIQIVSPVSGAFFAAAASCTLGDDSLAGALETAARYAVELEYWCAQGDCPLVLRDYVAEAAGNAAFYTDSLLGSPLATTTAVRDAAMNLAGQTADDDILTALEGLSTAVSDLHVDLCEVEEHRVDGRFTPYVDAVLLGDSADFDLEVTNHGTVTTTYAITVTGLPSAPPLLFSPTILPGETVTLAVNATPATLGVYDLIADITAVAPDVQVDVRDTAVARLNVVDKFVQVTQVIADPAFVETGTSATNLSVEIANPSGVVQNGVARTAVLAPDGSTAFTTDIPLSVLVGNPRVYDLASVDTSGWTAGVYTVTVDLLDETETLIPEGAGYGYFSVGQALGATHAVQPEVVAPGTVTVTTVITTEILADTIIPPQAAPLWPATGLRPVFTSTLLLGEEETAVPQLEEANATEAITATRPITDTPDTTLPSPQTIIGTVILRYEQDEAVTTGTWQNVGYTEASSGSYLRADAPGETAEFTVTGTWINIGFLADFNSGEAEILIDGISQGILDLYRRDITPISFVYDGLSGGSHTVTIVALGTANPLSGSDFVHVDYLDVYNGGSFTDGTFEQNDARLFLSTGWSSINDGNASGGSYIRNSNSTAWFPFTGDSVTFQALAYSSGGKTQIYIDGVYQTTLDLYNPLVSVTRTLSFEGLGAGPHVMQVTSYRGIATVDAFTTPGVAPFYIPPTPGSFARYEEEHPDFLFNGLPYAVTARTWTRDTGTIFSEASDGQVIYSRTAGDTASISFNGVWASVGFFTNQNSGQAEIFVDGVSQGVVDLYSNEDDVLSFSYDLPPGAHTLSVTVLGTANPLAGNQNVYLDYVDVWDGSALPEGTFEELDGRILRSGGWDAVANAGASGGMYIETGSGEPSAWFPFTGESVTYQAFDYFRSDEVSIYIDEVFQGHYDIRTGAAPTITYSFDNLGPGLHILKLRDYRNEPTLDAFITPAITPPTPPPTPTVFTRYEEDNPALRYNGLPYPITASSWDRTDNVFRASGGQYTISTTPGDWVSLDFSGTWLGVGFATGFRGGQVEVFIDGVSQEIVDLYSRDDDVISRYYTGLTDTAHTISVTLLTTRHPNSTGTQFMFDYIDTWNGSPLPNGIYEETHQLVYRSDDYDDWSVFADAAASGGSYIRDAFQHQGTAWFPFTGDSVTFLGLANNSSDRVEISIDGVSYGTFNLYSNVPVTRPFSFDGLGSGPHVMQIRHNRDYLTVDAFVVPGIAPFYQPPAYTGIVRYEEDSPDLVYNGAYDWRTRPQTWSANKNMTTVSGGWHVESNTAGNSVSLTFDGRWAAVGFRVRNVTSQAEIFIDGASQGVINLQNPAGEDVRSFQFGDLITGTHTISVSVVAGTVYFDYFDVWDGQSMSDELVNTRRAEDNGRLHYTSNLVDADNPNAIEGDMVVPSLYYANSNVWFTFVGDSFTLFGVTRNNNSSVNVYIDGIYVETADFAYPYSEQPRDFHYIGLDYGPHVVRISNDTSMRVDAFQANPAQPVPYLPFAEWWDNTPAGNGAPFFGSYGIASGMTAGDLDGDGHAEIVVTADDVVNFGTLFVFRGDGADTGDGDPILWSHDFGGGVYRTWVSSPALADLDGQPGAEVIVAAGDELWAFHADGSTYWNVPTANIFETLTAPAVGNLDLDPEPEIVANLGGTVEVREHDGTLAWSTAVLPHANPPVLADLTGDGLLDIILTGWDDDVWVYDYNNGAPQLVWTVVLTSSMGGTFGAPAVADIDGDGSPEVMVSHYGALTVLNGEDGSLVWTTPLDPGNPGGVSVADLDGDGQVNILTGMRYEFETDRFGMLYALNPDGSLLWSAVAEDSSSANNASVLDLNGDGAYEVAWNGREQGFTIYNGADGTILFNEPLANSATGTDYPLFVDVDADGYAEVIVPTIRGLVVFGQDGVWGEARPLWNQHSYHITNVNDDLTIPENEANSWQVHNTYRTQWPRAVVLPIYDVTLMHTVGIAGVTVLTDTFSTPPSASANPDYRWDYTQTWSQPVITQTFVSELADVQPGETRLVAQGTAVSYTLPSGTNSITLPPLYVTAPRILELDRAEETLPAGETAVFTATLYNPGTANDTYTLSAAGPGAAWMDVPSSAIVPAGGMATVQFTVTVPVGTAPDELPLLLDVLTGSGGQDQGVITLTVLPGDEDPYQAPPPLGVHLALQPEMAEGGPGATTVYTLTVTNLGDLPDTYDLSVDVPGGWTFELLANGTAVSSVTVLPSPYNQLPLRMLVTPPNDAAMGDYPITVSAQSQMETAVMDETTATLSVGNRGVAVALTPAAQSIPFGGTADWDLTVTNTGSGQQTYDLVAAGIPAPWVELAASSVTLNPGQSQVVQVTAANVALLPQTASLVVAATTRSNPAIAAEARADLTVTTLENGVLALTPATQTVTDSLDVLLSLVLTNTGAVLSSYDLTVMVAGGLAQAGSAQVGIPAGNGAVVPVAVQVPGPGEYEVEATAVSANGLTLTATAVLIVESSTPSGLTVYLPVVIKQP